ncbi:MAG: hypothetical protein Q4Q62_05110 [Thermoplasmata archaeon]|nr:hypothetical protein [Thermoplasmata archaeon]
MVVGEARIADVIVGNPNDVWERTRDGAGISRGFFDEYYRGRGTAVAYELDGVRSYPEQKSLADYGFRRPPQSFAYVDCRD